MFLKFASLAACLKMLSLASFRMFHVRTIGPTKKTCMSTIFVSVTKHFQSEHGIRFPIINGRILIRSNTCEAEDIRGLPSVKTERESMAGGLHVSV